MRRVILIVAFAASAAVNAQPVFAQTAERTLGPPLVKLDSDYTALLNEAKKLTQRGEFADAIELYQGLIEKGGDAVLEAAPGLYLPIAEAARRAIAELPPDGLRLYRSFYEPVAQRAVNEAVSKADAAAMVAVAARYPQTQAAVRALYLAAAYYLDAGEFAMAVRYLRRALAYAPKEPTQEVMMRVRLAAALARMGNREQAHEVVRELSAKFPNAVIKVAGENVKAVEFLDGLLAQTLPVIVAPRADENPADWPCVGGNAAGSRLMSDADFVLNPHWIYGFSDPMLSANFEAQVRSYRQMWGLDLNLELMPNALVVGDRVLVRSWNAIHCLDAYTGKLVFPRLETALESPPNPQSMLFETGRWDMTVYQGQIYYVENFPPAVHAGLQPQASRSNNLVAREAGSFKVLWRIGRGSGPDESLKNALFVGAPVAAEGRIYLLVVLFESFYLVCLDADTGKLQWRSFVSALPFGVLGGQMGGINVPVPAATPAVFGDSVVCVTNCGVVAAFDRLSGEVKWVVQYPSMLNQPVPIGPQPGFARRQVRLYPPNPLILTGEIVYVLPADSEELCAYSLESGKALWRASRGGRNYLAGLAQGKLVLCGPDIAGFDAKVGKLQWAPPVSGSLYGRPALSEKYLYASQREQGIVRVDLATGASTLVPLLDKDAPLGNLLMTQDKLIVTSGRFVASYLTYESAYRYHSKLIDAATSPAALPSLYRQRGVVSFSSQRFEKAIEDFQRAIELGRSHQQTDEVMTSLGYLYQSYIGAGLSQPLDKVGSYLDKAAACIAEMPADAESTKRARSELAFTYAKLHEAQKDYPRAVAVLQEILDTLPETIVEMQEVLIEGGRLVRTLNRLTTLNLHYARQEIGRLIAERGVSVYAAQDAQARRLRQEALGRRDTAALKEVARRFPFSAMADRALHDAAEIHFSSMRYKEAAEVLNMWLRRHPAREAPAAALAGLVMVYQKENRPMVAKGLLGRLAGLAPEQKLEFASYRGTVGEFVRINAAALGVDVSKLKAKWVDVPADLRLPLARLGGLSRFNVGGARQLLIGDDGLPLTANDFVLMLEPPPMSQLAAVDARTLEPAWKALADFGPAAFAVRQPWAAVQLAGRLYGDVLVVADREKIVGVDARSGKRSWVTSLSRPASALSATFGNAQVYVADQRGRFTALDPLTGTRLWDANVRPGSRYVQFEAGTEFVAIIHPSDAAVSLMQSRGDPSRFMRILQLQPQGAMARNPSTCYISCLSAATGKVASEVRIDGGEELSVRMTDNDQLLVCSDSYLRCYSASSGVAIWESVFGRRAPRVLALTEELIVLALDSDGRQELRAISAETGKVVWRTSLEDKGARVNAVSATLRGNQLLLMGGLQWVNMMPMRPIGFSRWSRANMQFDQVTGPRVVAVGLSDGVVQWVSRLSPELDDNVPVLIDSVIPTENQLVAVVKQQASAARLLVCIVDTNTGAPLQQVVVDDSQGAAVVPRRAAMIRVNVLPDINSAGAATVVNGVLVIEGGSEIQVFDKAPPSGP